MKIDPFYLNITSPQPQRVYEFYRDVVELPVVPDMGPHSLDAGGSIIGIDGHSETTGASAEPERVLVNFMVNGFDAFEARLDAAGATCVRRRGKETWGAVISTYEDPDGNYFQLFDWQSDPNAQPGVRELILNLNSKEPDRLNAFYRDVVCLSPGGLEWDLQIGAGRLIIDGHDAIQGKTKKPQRMLIDFWVENLDEEEQRLKSRGVPCIRSKGTEFWGGVISTFVDPDGNYFQLLEHHPELAYEGEY